MRPDQNVIDSDLAISDHRITAAILRGDRDAARRVIAAESRVLYLLGAAHIDREMGKVRSRRLPAPSTDRVVPLMAARGQMALSCERSESGTRRVRHSFAFYSSSLQRPPALLSDSGGTSD